jgi:hypothetical protein
MQIRTREMWRTIAMLLLAAILAGCVDRQEAPGLIGPSTSALFLQLSASPDQLPRDGIASSTITIVARDAESQALPGQKVQLAATAGTVTPTQITTNSNGEATATFTSPGPSPAVTSVTISAVPVSGNADEIVAPHTTVIALTTATAVPVTRFTFDPATPRQFDLVTFNSSSTTYGGVSCGSSCIYAWTFGDGASLTTTSVTVTHRYEVTGNFHVTLVATAPGGATAETSKQVPIGVMTAPSAVITYSPADPRAGETIYFDGRSSKSPDNLRIVEYVWDFGDGAAGTGDQVTHQYTLTSDPPPPHKYVVRLTIRDSSGRTGTTTVEVIVP